MPPISDSDHTGCKRAGRLTTKLAALLGACAFLTIAASASGANGQASCTGIVVSSLAGIPGLTAELERAFHEQYKQLGLPPGLFDSSFAKLRAGSVEGCIAAASG